MKKILLSILLIISLTACTSFKDKNSDATNETIPQPIVENEYEVIVKRLRFFIPKTLKVNEYNGYNLTYNYYLDTVEDNCDLKVKLLTKSSYDNSIDNFMNNYVKVIDGKYTSEKINNATWYLGSSSSNIVTYTTIKDDYFYNVSFYVSKSGTTCSKVDDMIKQTLFITSEE